MVINHIFQHISVTLIFKSLKISNNIHPICINFNLKIYGFCNYRKFHFVAWEQLPCLCIMSPSFVVWFKQYIQGAI